MPEPDPIATVWLTHPITSDAKAGFAPALHDVVAIFKQDVGLISLLKIVGNSDENILFLPTGITLEMLRSVFSQDSVVWRILTPGSYLRLSESNARLLRDLVVNANPNDVPIREAFVLPEAEEPSDENSKDLPVDLVDTLRTLQLALQIFNPTLLRKREFKLEISSIFYMLEEEAYKIGMNNYADMSSRARDEFRFGTRVFEELDRTGLTLHLDPNNLTDFESAMVKKFRENYFEEASIHQAFNEHTALPFDEDEFDDNDDRRNQVEFEAIVHHYIRGIRDADTGRFITIFWAHRSASNARDLAASDMIYVTESHNSIVLVQHKRLEAGDLSLYGTDATQKDALLSICRRQSTGCSNRVGNQYRAEVEMRILDCPIFYGLGSSILESEYMPACMIDRILQDCLGQPDERKRMLKRRFSMAQFRRAVNRTLIGSHPDEFGILKQTVLASWDTKILAVENSLE